MLLLCGDIEILNSKNRKLYQNIMGVKRNLDDLQITTSGYDVILCFETSLLLKSTGKQGLAMKIIAVF